MWEPQVSALEGDLQVLSPSLPGFGGTPLSQPELRMDRAADAMAAELDRAGIDRAAVCGLSMGGYVALELWRRHTHRVAGLLLANTRAEADDQQGRAKRRALAQRLRSEGIDVVAQDPPPLLSEGAGPKLWDRVRATIRRQPAEALAAASLGMAEREDFRAHLPDVGVPTVVLTSTGDELIPPEVSAPMAEAIPQADLVTLEGPGHLSSLEDPRGFNRALEGLLNPLP